MRELSISLFFSARDNEPKAKNIPWGVLREELSKHEARIKKDGKAWSPASYPQGLARSKDNVSLVHLLVFDVDHLPANERDEFFDRFNGLEYVAHTTHSGPLCWRVVLPLKTPSTATGWADRYRAAAEHFGIWDKVDQSCRDPSRLYYLPSAPQGTEALVVSETGEWFDFGVVAAFSKPTLKVAPAASEPHPSLSGAAELSNTDNQILLDRVTRGESLAPHGNRDNTINKVASILAMKDPTKSPEQLLAVLTPSIRAMDCEPEGLEHWIAKATDCLTRAHQRATETHAHEAELAEGLLEAAKNLAGDGQHEIEAKIQRKQIKGQPGPAIANERNIGLILRNHPAWKDKVRFNELTKQVECVGTPIDQDGINARHTALAAWLQGPEFLMPCSPPQAGGALLQEALRHRYNPLREYVEQLPEWDRVPRIENFFGTYVPVKEENPYYVKCVSRCFFIAAAARALNPGCQMDNFLILEGVYGIRKSQLVRTLGHPFVCATKLDFHSKDTRMLASRYWLIEVPELVGMSKHDREALKAFMSIQSDAIRLPYAPAMEDFPRSCLFIGTTNEGSYLQEPNRREWPLKLSDLKIDLEKIEEIRPQLFAEARHRFKAGEPWWLSAEDESLAMAQAATRLDADHVEEVVRQWYFDMKPADRPHMITLYALATKAFQYSRHQLNAGIYSNIRHGLRRLGIKQVVLKVAGRTTKTQYDLRVLDGFSEGREDSETVGQSGGELRPNDDMGLSEEMVVPASEGDE